MPKIAVVDDIADNRHIIGFSLSQDCEVSEFEGGATFLEMAKITRFDLVILDITMPGMTGLEVIKQLRINPDYQSVPVIAVTARAMANDKKLILDSGFTEYISKPFSPDELRERIRAYLGC